MFEVFISMQDSASLFWRLSPSSGLPRILYAWNLPTFQSEDGVSFSKTYIDNNSYLPLFLNNQKWAIHFSPIWALRESWDPRCGINIGVSSHSNSSLLTFIRFWNLSQSNRDYLLFVLSRTICKSFISFDINASIIVIFIDLMNYIDILIDGI